jgi:[ribosomal protein S5]-alanine N-acetyltransferase
MSTKIYNLPSGQVTIHTSRLILRGAHLGDEKHLNSAFSDPEVMRYWSEPPHKSMERTAEWIGNMIKGPQNGITDFIITLKDAATTIPTSSELSSPPADPSPNYLPIGKIGIWTLNSTPTSLSGEIGFLLSRPHWHKGLALEALHAVLPYFFQTKKFDKITADIDPRNQASKGILRKVGFKKWKYEERSAEIGGVWVDSEWLRMERGDWEGREGIKNLEK